jgi:hypothetical protein
MAQALTMGRFPPLSAQLNIHANWPMALALVPTLGSRWTVGHASTTSCADRWATRAATHRAGCHA